MQQDKKVLRHPAYLPNIGEMIDYQCRRRVPSRTVLRLPVEVPTQTLGDSELNSIGQDKSR